MTSPLPDAAAVRARGWLRGHPRVLDVLLAAAVFGVIMVVAVTASHYPKGPAGIGQRDLPAHTVALALVCGTALALRRRFPTPVLAVTVLAVVADLALGTVSHDLADRHTAMAIAVVVALFTVATRTDRPTTWRVGLLAVTVTTAAAMLLGPQPWYVAENLGIFAWTGLAVAAGEAVRTRRAMVDAIRERAERAERTREEEARRRVAEERMRIARELHDVVAHHIAMVNVQAGVASHVMDSRPDQAKEALSHVRAASRQALSELQTTVGLLRQQDEPVAPTEPAPGLGMLDDLVEGFRRTGMRVTAEVLGPDEPLSSAVDLAAYRVVQEALTNVHKHAGATADAQVSIRRAGTVAGPLLEITVLDDGPAGDAPAPAGGGHGLTGMCERAEALGGDCVFGPLPGGGFRVHVTLPLRPDGGSAGEVRGRRVGCVLGQETARRWKGRC